AKVRDLPLDAGQVLEIGRRREEEDIDTLRVHALAEPPAPLREVAHHETLKPSQHLASQELHAVLHVKSRVASSVPAVVLRTVGASTRAGRYMKQRTGYAAFIPAPLPPDPPIVLDGPLHALLSRADQA